MSDTKQQAADLTGAVEAAPAPPIAKPPRKKSGCGCMLPLLILAVLVGMAPRIISHTSLRNQVPAMLLKELPPGVEIGSAEVGWLTPIALNDVVIPDDHGRPALRIKHLTMTASLWELSSGGSDLGSIVIEEPVLELIVENGVTNYYRLLTQLTMSGDSTGPLPRLDLKILDGRIALFEAPLKDPLPPENERHPLLELALQTASFSSQPGAENDLKGEIVALITEPAIAEPITASLAWNLPMANENGIGQGSLRGQVPQLPLEAIAPWIEPYTSGRTVSGTVAASLDADVIVGGDGHLFLGAGIQVAQLDLRLSGTPLADGTIGDPTQWAGENLTFTAEGSGDSAGQLANFQSIRLRTPFVDADFAGTVADLPGQIDCDLLGTTNVDIGQLLTLVPSEIRSNLRIEGLQLGQLRVKGPLSPATTEKAALPALRVSAELGWSDAEFYGFRSQDASLQVHYADQAIEIDPNRLPVSGGAWVAAPRIELGDRGAELVFDGGPIVEGIQLTPEMSQSWLKYVSPLIGSASTIEGIFSLSASPTRVALRPPYEGKFYGVLRIESAKAGAGPTTEPILEAVAALQTMLGRKPTAASDWIVIDQQSVPFDYADGRVTHRGLQARIGELSLVSQGTVGLDNTLDIELSMPIPDRWTEGKPVLAGLKGQAVPFRMQGTLDQPQLDRRALGEFGKRIGFSGAAGLLEGLLQRRREKIEDGTIRPRPRKP